MVTFTYVRNFTCTQFCDGLWKPHLQDDAWPPEYSILVWMGTVHTTPEMNLQPDGPWTYTTLTPANKTLGIFVNDPAVYTPSGGGSARTGAGISANGVRLKDSAFSA